MGINRRTIHVPEVPTSQPKPSKKAFKKAVESLGDKIRAKRGERGINQRELAQKLNVSRRRIQDWGRDRKDSSDVEWVMLAHELGLHDGIDVMKASS